MKPFTPCVMLLALITLPNANAHAQGDMAAHRTPAARSTSLTITGLGGASRTVSPDEFKALPHTAVQVHNAHTNKDESYSGVPVKDLLAMVPAPAGSGKSVSPNMQVVVAGATDNFHVVLTACDTNPECRSGQAIVADTQDGAPIAADGAYKLILTEDKKPARWARNLQSLTVKAVSAD